MIVEELLLPLKSKDLPNWLSLLLSFLIVPLIRHWWRHRTVRSIRNFHISFRSGNIQMNGSTYQSLSIRFSNHTGSRVYLSNVRLTRPTSRFHVAPGADRDVYSDSYILRFPDDQMRFVFLEVVIDPDQKIETTLALTGVPTEEITNYRLVCWRKLLRIRKYFLLNFEASIGSKRYRVSLPY